LLLPIIKTLHAANEKVISIT